MYEIIEDLGHMKANYLREVQGLEKDIEREYGYIEVAEERIAHARDRMRHAQGFINQYDTAIAVLQRLADENRE